MIILLACGLAVLVYRAVYDAVLDLAPPWLAWYLRGHILRRIRHDQEWK